MKKNICIFLASLSWSGGTTKCAVTLANALVQNNDFNIFIIDIANPNKETFFQLSKDVFVKHLNCKNLLQTNIEIYHFLKNNNITAMICVEAMLGIYSIFPCKILKVKNIIWEHGNFYQKQCKTIDIVRKLEIKLCDFYITLTKKDKKNFQEHFKGKCHIDYIYNPLITPNQIPTYNASSKKILSVGVIREIKGFDMLVDVAKKVFEKHPDWSWEIYGENTTDYALKIQEKIKFYNLDKQLFLKGLTHNINSEYSKSSFVVMTSRMEGLPMVLLEAKAHKLPIVSFDIQTGPSDIVRDNQNGFLIEPYNIEKMAEKINLLIENDDLRKQFSDNAILDSEKFTPERIIEQWTQLLHSL